MKRRSFLKGLLGGAAIVVATPALSKSIGAGPGGIVRDFELMDVSLVSTPTDPNALIVESSGDSDIATVPESIEARGIYFGECIYFG